MDVREPAISAPMGVVLVIRADDAEQAIHLARGAIRGGIDAVEITLTVPGAIEVIRNLAGTGARLGVGTVLDPRDVAPAVDAGASFVVAPNTDPAVIDAAHAVGVAVVAGALTPTEIQHAFTIGSDAVKVFPAGAVGGPAYIQEIAGPLPHIPCVVSGGVSIDNAADYFTAGARAVCVGRDMFPAMAASAGDENVLADLTRRFMAAARPTGG